ncbi:transmembrane and immunoglobulin domain-containing protein 2 isoform X2 [Elephas maximus indicus]|uniref:transmembrane and immunoglobulin domain-containing protein 2 isoform X2 n=1 Tax=Elephas maximus indicus TaxID=99487 RepID=UPI0021165A42|nr:transmembrane and immunoglobulin domain-containing protein 2 isoform X2 [Elephas maximus indicus]
MESASTALVLLVQLSALLGTTSLSVKQGPTSLWVEQGSQVTLTCQVAYAQAWERLRIGWTKDGQVLCQTHVTNNSLSLGVCGPRGWLVWQSPGNLTLRLDQVSANDSGDYVCWAAVEIPELEESEGNGTHLLVAPDDPQGTPASSFPGLLSSLLMAGVVVVAAIALGAGIWGRRRRLHRDSGNHFYSNVLYRPQGTPKKTKAWPGERKVLDPPRSDQKGQSFYSTSFPQPPKPQPCLPPNPQPCLPPNLQPCLPPRPCPSLGPSHPISTMVSPSPRAFEQPWPRGSPRAGRRV